MIRFYHDLVLELFLQSNLRVKNLEHAVKTNGPFWPSGSAFDFVSLQSPKYHGTAHHVGRLLSTEPIGRMHDHNFRIQTLKMHPGVPVNWRVTLPLKKWIPSDVRMKPQTSLHQTQPWVLQLTAGWLRAMGDERVQAHPSL